MDTDHGRKRDRRIDRTVNALRDALMALVVECGYPAITIQDITERADVARATFYLHFKDKDDLMFRSMREIYDQVAAEQISRPLTWENLSDAGDFRHVAQYADFYAAMLSERGSMGFLTRVRAYLNGVFLDSFAHIMPKGATPPVPVDMLASYCSGAQIGLNWWWVENRMPIPAEDMARLGMQISLNGLAWSLGYASAAVARQTIASDEP